MHMETGVFGQLGAEGVSPEVFSARVVIPRTEFARLGLGDHERPGALPACFRWLLAVFGPGGERWSVRLREGEDALVHFARQADAFAFFARWSASQGTGSKRQHAA
jgi:hypothetical protein